MTEQQIKYYISSPRLSAFSSKAINDFEKIILLYKTNIEIAESLYPILSILEVSLRNAIHEVLKSHFNDPYWFKNCLPDEFSPYVSKAIQKLTARRKTITPDGIIAELSFGFWNRLFHRNHTKLLWKSLITIFKHIPKHLRQRSTIDECIFRIRTLRNRIYHYEPVFTNLQDLENLYNEMLTFLTWLDKGLPYLLTDIDRFYIVLEKAKKIDEIKSRA